MGQIISFTKTKLPFGWLGNMSPATITIGSESWRTTEALFQAMRFIGDTEELAAIRETIRLEKSPMTAKMIAKSHAGKMTIKQMSDLDLDHMRICLLLKVEQCHGLKQQLLDTGDAIIIEDCSSRPQGSGLFWGAQKTSVPDVWDGKNMLGKLWMELRGQLSK